MELRCDKGTFSGSFSPESWELLIPFAITPDEFLATRSKLAGFQETSKVFPISCLGDLSGSGGDPLQEISSRVKRLINVRHVQTTPMGEVYFASCARKVLSEEKVLISVQVSSGYVL